MVRRTVDIETVPRREPIDSKWTTPSVKVLQVLLKVVTEEVGGGELIAQ